MFNFTNKQKKPKNSDQDGGIDFLNSDQRLLFYWEQSTWTENPSLAKMAVF